MSKNNRWIRHVKISGNPYERGRQIGEYCREEVANTVESYWVIFKSYASLDDRQIRKLAIPFIDIIAKYDPEIMEEISGIAEAIDRPVEDLVAVNARTELMFNLQPPQCTTIAMLPEATANRGLFMGQNWDWIERLKKSLVLLEINQEGKPTVLVLGEAGIVGKFGINSSGIGVCLNILMAEGNGAGVPVHVLLRGILNSNTLGDAIGAVLRHRAGSSSYFLIGSHEGMAVGIEVCFEQAEVLYPGEGLLTHANHFVGSRIRYRDKGRAIYPDSVIRDHRALKQLQPKLGSLTPHDLKAVLKDHLNYPHSICRHPRGGADRLQEIITLSSIMMDFQSRALFIAKGPPCENEYVPYSFPDRS